MDITHRIVHTSLKPPSWCPQKIVSSQAFLFSHQIAPIYSWLQERRVSSFGNATALRVQRHEGEFHKYSTSLQVLSAPSQQTGDEHLESYPYKYIEVLVYNYAFLN